MSTGKVSKSKQFSFEKVLERFENECGRLPDSQIASIIGVHKSTFSNKRKKEKFFPPDWAFYLAQEYELLTEWLLTGKGPKRISEQDGYKYPILKDIELWIDDMMSKDPDSHAWFNFEFKRRFENEFGKYLLRREIKESTDNISPSTKLA